MSEADDYVRSFGMSGYLITEELKSVEKAFDLELGHTLRESTEGPVAYYPQFEQAVRAEAKQMAGHYELFYCLEQSIRKLIGETLGEASEGVDWWVAKVPQQIRDDVNGRIKQEVDSGVTRRSEAPIDYTTFGELAVIITANWDGLFSTIFTSRRAVEGVMKSLNLLRGPIAHCCPLSEDEVDRLELAVKDWFRMIG